jgi:hypothetical protein
MTNGDSLRRLHGLPGDLGGLRSAAGVVRRTRGCSHVRVRAKHTVVPSSLYLRRRKFFANGRCVVRQNARSCSHLGLLSATSEVDPSQSDVARCPRKSSILRMSGGTNKTMPDGMRKKRIFLATSAFCAGVNTTLYSLYPHFATSTSSGTRTTSPMSICM